MLLAICFLIGLFSAPVHARAYCEPDYVANCIWVNAGAESLETARAQGAEVVRFFNSSMWMSHDIMVELRRDRRGVVRLALRDPVRRTNEALRTVAASEWDRFVTLRQQFIDARRAARRTYGRRSPVACLDGSYPSVDSVLRGRIEHLEFSSCSDGDARRISDMVQARVYALLPHCLMLDVLVRGYCASLAGDGKLAATFTPQVVGLSRADACAPDRDIAALIGPRARLRIADVTGNSGGVWVGRNVLRQLCRRKLGLRIDRIAAKAGVLNVTGSMRGNSRVAPATQIWRIDGDEAKLEQWNIGPSVPETIDTQPASPAPMPVPR